MTLPRAALRRPITVVVAVVAVVLAGVMALRQMPRDILPNLAIPIIYVAQPDLAHDDAKTRGLLHDRKDLEEAIVHGAVKRVRPKTMTVMAAFMGLMPIMWSTGAGADVMKRIAARWSAV